MRARCLAALLLCLGFGCRPKQVDPDRPGHECAEDLNAWVQQCGQSQHLTMTPVACPKGSAVVEISGAAALRVEITHDHPAFRRVGPIGFSPLGDFPDWSREPVERRQALDGLAACVDSARAENLKAALDHAWVETQPWRWPWLLVLASVLLLFVGRRGAGTWHLQRRQVLSVVGLFGGTYLVRWLLIEPAFFHQWGHGPGFLAASRGHGPLYGPGFVELFGWFVYGPPYQQELLVFAANGALGALLPLSLWAVLRAVGVRGWVSWAVAILAAIDPLLGRIALSESYFNMGSLLAAATATLAVSYRLTTDRFARSAAIIAAGLIASQAVRVHPMTWVPTALIPLVLLALPGSFGARILRTVLASFGVGLTVLVSSGAAILEVFSNPLGHRWGPTAQEYATIEPRRALRLVGAVLALSAILWALRGLRRFLLPLLVSAIVLTAYFFMLGMTVKGDLGIYQGGMFSLYLGPLVGGAFAFLAPLLRWRRVNVALAAVLMLVGLGALSVRWKPTTTWLTDQWEAREALRWRRALPPQAEVWFLANSDAQTFRLPLWPPDQRPALTPVGHELSSGELAQVPEALLQQGQAFYYRSSVCSRPLGRATCEAIEARLDLELLNRWEFPALTPTSPAYVTPTVPVALYRIRSLKPQ